MNVYDTITLTIYSNDGIINGRTTIQKLIYFNSIKISNVDIQTYTHYFYGPFSSEVAIALEKMVILSYVNEISYSGFYDTYKYQLTEKGKQYAKRLLLEYPQEFKKISDIVIKCKKFCELKPKPLSFAAKAYYILINTDEGRKGKYDLDDVRDVAENFDWSISTEDVKTGVSLLQELNLVQTK